jgi:CHC2 zinc finger
MSRRFDSTDNAELRAKIDKAKPRLPVPDLMRELGYEEKHIGRTAICPFHDDHDPSFSVFKGSNGKGWQWKCQAGCGHGDEIALLVKHFGISRDEAIKRYLEMAGFPPRTPRKSHECPESHLSPECPVSYVSPECPVFPVSPECPVSPVFPVSEGQAVDGEMDKLKALAAQNACTQLNTARARRFKLLRDLKAVEKEIGRKLQVAELAIAFDEWHRLSLPFLDPAKTREHYEAKFLSEYAKVRYATGEGTLATALENVAKLPPDQLSIIPNKPNAPDSWRRLAALHCELARLTVDGYFLSYRGAAKVFDGLSHQEAYEITGALATLGVITFVGKGQPGLNSGKAAEFRYLLDDSYTW